DDGLFGPRSLPWRLHRERGLPLAGLRALMVQALHPLAMAGVAQHSTWRRDPMGRLAATTGYVLTITYADTATALGAAAQVRRIHERVVGVDDVTGLPYSAGDPELLLWVHMALVESIVDVARRYGRRLDDADADRYVAEMAPFAEVLGVPRALIPTATAGLDAALAATSPLVATPAAREAIAILLDPPGLDEDMRELWQDLGEVAAGLLPDWARRLYGWDAAPADLLDREAVRQLLGVLDVAFEAQPGVLEARRRIDERMRAA
ncbi:MAG TPA: oxygenase MpaB family protein, partial [Candidatus Dormibacteraeota bacterium]|nr:oxygenase MpaB family protein [Candidatus Dormibacteraeota bacterium]